MSDTSRFAELCLPHLDSAYNLARWLTRDSQDAQDVVQDACVRALKYMGSLQGNDARAWFLTIVRNTFYDWLARNRPAEVVHDENDTVDAAAETPVEPLWTKAFVTVVTTQMAFGYASSAFVLLPKYLSTELHASASDIGHVVAVTGLAAVAAIPFVGAAIDRFGRKPLVILGCVLTAIYAFGWLLVSELSGLMYALQALGGIAFMIAFNAAGTLVTDQAPPARLGQAFMAIDPNALAGNDVYLERVETLVDAMLDDEGVRLPGDRRRKLRDEAVKHGLDLPDALMAQLRTLAGAG